VVLFGNTGTGKIKIMNALWGGEILSSGHVTSNVCCIEGAAVERIRVIVADASGHEEESSLDLNNVLSSFSTNIPHSKWIRVFLPQDSCPLLREGVVLCDTPGIDGDKDSDEVLVSTCTDADVFVYVCDGTCTIENTEREYLLQVRDTFSNLTPNNLFIVFNHWDVVCMDENAGDVRGQHVERASKFLSEEFGFERNSMKDSVFFISAKDFLDVHQGSMNIGDLPVQRRNCYREFQSFEKRLKDCLTTYSRQTKYNRHCQSIRSCSEEATAILKRTQEVIEEKRRCAASERAEAARELAALQDAVSEFKEELDKTCHTTTEHIKEQVSQKKFIITLIHSTESPLLSSHLGNRRS
jgi:mitofusin